MKILLHVALTFFEIRRVQIFYLLSTIIQSYSIVDCRMLEDILNTRFMVKKSMKKYKDDKVHFLLND